MVLNVASYVGAIVMHLALPIVSEYRSTDHGHLRFPKQYLIYYLLRAKVFIP
jgi:hypothetical protein